MRISLWFMAVLGAAIAAILVVNPNYTIFIGIFLQNIFGATHPPPIAKEPLVGMDWRTTEEASRRLTAFLRQKFPTGSNASDLRSTLLSQGFEPPPPPSLDCLPPTQTAPIGKTVTPCPAYDRSKVLGYSWGNGACVQNIWIKWAKDGNETIKGVDASYYSYCL